MNKQQPDAKLRKLWPQYVQALSAYRVVREKSEAAREVFDQEHGALLEYLDGTPLQERVRMVKEHSAALKASPAGPLYDERNAAGRAVRKLVRAIRKTPAKGLTGILIKLSAMESYVQGEDLAETIEAVEADLVRLTGQNLPAERGEIPDFHP